MVGCPHAFPATGAICGWTHAIIFDSMPCRQNTEGMRGDNRMTSNRDNRKPAAMKTLHAKRFTLGVVAGFFLLLTALRGAIPAPLPPPTAGPAESPAPAKSGPQEPPAASA